MNHTFCFFARCGIHPAFRGYDVTRIEGLPHPPIVTHNKDAWGDRADGAEAEAEAGAEAGSGGAAVTGIGPPVNSE